MFGFNNFHHRSLRLIWEEVSIPTGGDSNTIEKCYVHDDDEQKARPPPPLSIERGNLYSVLEVAKQEMFIEEPNPHSYQWLHDNIQEAALLSIEPDLLDELKRQVGMVLLVGLSQQDLDDELFVIANLLMSYEPNNDYQAFAAIGLYLRAAEKAMSLSAFASAAKYSQKGISCLPLNGSCWENCFDQSLRLYSLATEACGYLGRVREMWEYSGVILDPSSKCSVLDKLRAYLVRIEYLGNAGNPFDAVDLAISVLDELGCSFPKRGAVQAMQTIRVLGKLKKNPPSPAALRNLPPIKDRNKREIIKIIFRLEAIFYYTKQVFLYALASAKTIELVLEYGLCDYSAGAFFTVGNILTAMSGDMKHIINWSKLSRHVTEVALPLGTSTRIEGHVRVRLRVGMECSHS